MKQRQLPFILPIIISGLYLVGCKAKQGESSQGDSSIASVDSADSADGKRYCRPTPGNKCDAGATLGIPAPKRPTYIDSVNCYVFSIDPNATQVCDLTIRGWYIEEDGLESSGLVKVTCSYEKNKLVDAKFLSGSEHLEWNCPVNEFDVVVQPRPKYP